MIYWKRGSKVNLSKNFSANEFECRCGKCDLQQINATIVSALQTIREEIDMPMTITSAFRCKDHQARLRGQGIKTAKGISQHELGNAVDVHTKDLDKLLKSAEQYFDAIGVAKTFLHFDLRTDKKRRWDY